MDFEEKELEAMLENWSGFVKFPTKETLKKMKYKVRLENLFSPIEFKKLCKLEKTRIKNINNNLSIMLLLGMPLPSENALRVKVGLTPHRKLILPSKLENMADKNDETWQPYKSKAAKPHALGAHEYGKRQKFILTKCMSHDGSAIDIQNCKQELSSLVGSWPSEFSNALEDGKTAKNEKSSVQFKVKNKPPVSYSMRGIKKDFTEPDVPDDDHYLYCDTCSKVYDGECPTHGPYLSVDDTKIKWGLTDRARRTCPNGISISPSKIRSSGLGAWADKDFPVNSVFGPYEGVDVHKDDLQKLKLTFDGGYAWEIYKNGYLSHYVDGSDQKKGNWLRFVNCARTEDEQNLVAYQYKGKIYYRSFKEIKRGMELLVWYGEQYAEQLGILVKEKLEKTGNLPQKKISDDYLECEKCGQLLTDEETLQKHLKSKHPDRSVVKRFKCEFCSYSSDNSGNYNNHIRTHTKEKPFECSYCSKRFSQKVHLNGHISSIHTNNRPFECNKCDKKFVNLSLLKQHIRAVHDKYRSYVCDVCDLKFIGAKDLKTHKLIHSGVRDHKCQYCGKRFTQQADLHKHERLHTGEKPYKCKECFVAFTFSYSLRHHVIVHHTRNFPHKCSVCDKGFLSPGLLKKHSIRCQGWNVTS